MSRHERQRLEDIVAAVNAIRTHLGRGNLSDGLAFDAVRVRLIEIGEAVKTLSADSLASEAVIPWDEIAQRRDRLAHGTSTPRTRSSPRPSNMTFENLLLRSAGCLT
jgi:uncharacterized protein with HEPN domain